MAKIKGVKVVEKETWTGRDGYGLLADVFVDNKKVGTYRDDGDGSMPYLDTDASATKIIKERAEKYFDEFPPDLTGANITNKEDPKKKYHFMFDENAFIEEILALNENEKLAKKEYKKGYNVIVFTKYPIFAKGPHPRPFYGHFKGIDAGDKAKAWINAQKTEWPLMSFQICENLKDFTIE